MKRVLLISLAVIFFIGLLIFTFLYSANFSDGYRAGTIVKMSHKGAIFKTWEGQLHLGGLIGSGESDVASGIWNFSIDSDEEEVREKIEDAVDGGYRVKLYYKEKYMTFFWRGDTKYFVYRVEPIGKDSSKGNSP